MRLYDSFIYSSNLNFADFSDYLLLAEDKFDGFTNNSSNSSMAFYSELFPKLCDWQINGSNNCSGSDDIDAFEDTLVIELDVKIYYDWF